jgi:hypothetical protein
MADVTRGEIVDILTGFAANNPEYRAALLENPKEMLGRQLGRELPDWLNVKAVEETADTIYVVVPHVPQEGEELADGDLEQIAGGKSDDSDSSSTSYTCNDTTGVATRVEVTTDVGFM